MINEKYIDLITGHLQGTLNADDQQKLSRLLEEGKITYSDFEEMEVTCEQLDMVLVPLPGSGMKDRFNVMLQTEKNREANSLHAILSGWKQRLQGRFEIRHIGYAAGIFLAGLFIGTNYNTTITQDNQIEKLTDEVSQMREMMMITLLDNSSPTERLRAVNISTEIQSADNRVIEALLETLNKDSNVNVRIAAIDALLHHASNSAVRSGMVRSISSQESPVVQVALADAMLVLQEKQSVEEFRKLLEKNGLDNSVRSKLENTIVALI